MNICKSILILTLGLVNFCECLGKWRLDQSSRNQKLHKIGDRLWTTRSTFGRVFCAVLCFQNNDCSFFGHQNKTCLGYKSTEPRAKLNMMTCSQGNFKIYSESRVAPTVGSSCDRGGECTSIGTTDVSLQADRQGSVLFRIRDKRIIHASSLAASRVHENIMYTINDGTSNLQENIIYVIDLQRGKTGRNTIRLQLNVANAVNGDWEAAAVGPCNKESCIYIGDIGKKPTTGVVKNHIYRLREPEPNEILAQRTMGRPLSTRVPYIDRLTIRWAERKNQEGACLMIDPIGNAYIISTAEDNQSRMARIPVSYWKKRRIRLKTLALLSTDLTEGSPVACDLSRDGKEMLIKFRSSIYYWSVPDGDYEMAIKETGRPLPFNHRANIKAVAWSPKGDGYYTLPRGYYPELSLYPIMK